MSYFGWDAGIYVLSKVANLRGAILSHYLPEKESISYICATLVADATNVAQAITH